MLEEALDEREPLVPYEGEFERQQRQLQHGRSDGERLYAHRAGQQQHRGKARRLHEGRVQDLQRNRSSFGGTSQGDNEETHTYPVPLLQQLHDFDSAADTGKDSQPVAVRVHCGSTDTGHTRPNARPNARTANTYVPTATDAAPWLRRAAERPPLRWIRGSAGQYPGSPFCRGSATRRRRTFRSYAPIRPANRGANPFQRISAHDAADSGECTHPTETARITLSLGSAEMSTTTITVCVATNTFSRTRSLQSTHTCFAPARPAANAPVCKAKADQGTNGTHVERTSDALAFARNAESHDTAFRASDFREMLCGRQDSGAAREVQPVRDVH